MLLRTTTLSKSLLVSISLTSATLLAAPSATAQDKNPPISISANVNLTNDYRFRGVSLSNKDFAIQGGFNIAHESGFYLGTWGSSIESYNESELELDIYGGYSGALTDDLSFNIGFIAYLYPGSTGGTDYTETYASISGSADIVSWTLGAAYAFKQDNIGDNDNIYLYANAGVPLSDKISANASLGYEDGAFGTDKWDWSLGLSYSLKQYSLSVNYIDTANTNSTAGDAGIIVGLSASF